MNRLDWDTLAKARPKVRPNDNGMSKGVTTSHLELKHPEFDDSSSGTQPDASLRKFGTEFSWSIPLHYQSNHAYPLVVWLHSTGSDQRQLNDVMPMINQRNYVGVSIQGTEAADNGKFGWLQAPDSIEATINHVRYAIDMVSTRFNINQNRVFVAGRGTGGTMAYRVAFAQSNWFAGVGSINGSLPSNLKPLGNLRSCRQLPVFWAHGRDSIEFPEANLCHQLRLLHVAGFDVTLRQYPCGDRLFTQVYSDLNTWMMEQIASTGANIIR